MWLDNTTHLEEETSNPRLPLIRRKQEDVSRVGLQEGLVSNQTASFLRGVPGDCNARL